MKVLLHFWFCYNSSHVGQGAVTFTERQMIWVGLNVLKFLVRQVPSGRRRKVFTIRSHLRSRERDRQGARDAVGPPIHTAPKFMACELFGSMSPPLGGSKPEGVQTGGRGFEMGDRFAPGAPRT